MASDRWKRFIDLTTAISTALSGIAALVAVLLSVHFYHSTTDQENDQSLTELYRSYLQLTLEHPDLFKKFGSAPSASFVTTTAEAIYLKAGDDKGWQETIINILDNQRELIQSVPVWDCGSMNKDFVGFVHNDAHVQMACSSDEFK